MCIGTRFVILIYLIFIPTTRRFISVYIVIINMTTKFPTSFYDKNL